MREQPKRDWLPGSKQQWSTPKMREIPLTDELIARFNQSDILSLTDAVPAKKSAARR